MSVIETLKTNSAELIIDLQKKVKALDDTMLNGVTHASIAAARDVRDAAERLRRIVHFEHTEKQDGETARNVARAQAAAPAADTPAPATQAAPETATAAAVVPTA